MANCNRYVTAMRQDGEPFLWRAVLELLRLLAPRVIEASSRESCLEVIRHARHAPAVTEKALFHSIASHEVAMPEWLKDFSQKVPLPSGERGGGTCFDMWRNSTLAGLEEPGDEEGDEAELDMPEGDVTPKRPAPRSALRVRTDAHGEPLPCSPL